MTEYRAVNIRVEGINVIVLAKNGKVDLKAITRIQEWLRQDEAKKLLN